MNSATTLRNAAAVAFLGSTVGALGTGVRATSGDCWTSPFSCSGNSEAACEANCDWDAYAACEEGCHWECGWTTYEWSGIWQFVSQSPPSELNCGEDQGTNEFFGEAICHCFENS